jgi:hypothetical protein
MKTIVIIGLSALLCWLIYSAATFEKGSQIIQNKEVSAQVKSQHYVIIEEITEEEVDE